MNKRTFLKKSAVLGLGSFVATQGLTAQIINSTNNTDSAAGDRWVYPQIQRCY